MYTRNSMDLTDYHQRFFRPSCLPALNLRFGNSDFFNPYYGKKHDEILLPQALTHTPEETLLNYFSILREAFYFNMEERSCGTIGNATLPFPIAYNFLSRAYKKRVSYENYLHSFDRIGHTTLIKLCQVPNEKGRLKFFYEIETIQVFLDKEAEYFGYSYGFIDLVYEDNGYRISDISQIAEDFLCAPYHGWQQDGESIIDIKYGRWCNLLKKREPTIKTSYAKYIYFHGNDGAYYCFIYFTLTNGTDIEIAQFRRMGNEEWHLIKIHPEKDCLNIKTDL